MASHASATPMRLPSKSERQRLQEVHGKNLPARPADAFHDGDALDLLPHEHTRHARHGDAAEHDDHETDEAEIVFRALEVLADLFLAIPIRPHADELRPQLCLQFARQRVDLRFGNPQQHLTHHTAAERQQPGSGQILVVDQHARTQAERAERPARLQRNHASNGEIAIGR